MGLTVAQSGESTEAGSETGEGTTGGADAPTTSQGPTADPDTTNGPTQPPTGADETTAEPTLTTGSIDPGETTTSADETSTGGGASRGSTDSEGMSTGECVPTVWYADQDGDGYGDMATVQMACEQPEGYVDNPDDCDDFDMKRSPGEIEVCDNKDNDCDELVDEYSAMNTMCGPCKIVPDDPNSPTRAYYFCKTPMKSWSGAQGLCEMLTAELVSDEGDAEHAFLTEQVTKIDPMSGGWWTGGHATGVLGYEWLSGAAISGADGRWDFPQAVSDPNKCVQLLSSGVMNGDKWTPRSCNEMRPYICEQML